MPKKRKGYLRHLIIVGVLYFLAVLCWIIFPDPQQILAASPIFLIAGLVEGYWIFTMLPRRKGTGELAERKILVITANPKQTGNLRIGEELRKIKEQLRASTHRDDFLLEFETASTVNTITMAFQKVNPQIVHFSGHGTGMNGLLVETENGNIQEFPNGAMATLFESFRHTVDCVVLNACFSRDQAKLISDYGIYVVGMSNEIEDEAAIEFARGFYQSLGEGSDYAFAYDMAMVNYSAFNSSNVPELWYGGKKLKPEFEGWERG